MALSMDQLKAAFKKRTETDATKNTGFWNLFYPFYKMDFDQTAIFRFLPDLNDENPWGFVVENQYHQVWINGKKKQVACNKMYGEDCPLCDASQKHYNAGDTETGKKFWRKIDYVAQGYIVSSPFDAEIKPEDNPVRLVSLNPSIFENIEKAISAGDFSAPPFDLISGCDFRLQKTKKGEHANYSTSVFARKETSVPNDILNHPKFELYDLKKYCYAQVDKAQLEAIVNAIETGSSIEENKPSQSGTQEMQKPGVNFADAAPSKPIDQVKESSSQDDTPAPVAQSDKTKEILERIRKAQAAKQSA